MSFLSLSRKGAILKEFMMKITIKKGLWIGLYYWINAEAVVNTNIP